MSPPNHWDLTPEQVRARVEEIRRIADDDEAAHRSEDALWSEVLAAIAAGSPHAKEIAAVALMTADIDFARWCA